MKRTLFIIISVMPLIALADDPLPKRSDFNRYQAMLTRSPFAIATVAAPNATPDSVPPAYLPAGQANSAGPNPSARRDPAKSSYASADAYRSAAGRLR